MAKQFYKLSSGFFLLLLFFIFPVTFNKALAFSGKIYSPNNLVLGNENFDITTIASITQADIANAAPSPANSNFTCGPIVNWGPTTLLYYNGGLQQQQGGEQYPITQTQGSTTVQIYQYRGVTWQGIKEGLEFSDGNNCVWTDPNSTMDNSYDFTSNSNPLISLTNLPAAFNYPFPPNTQASIDTIPNISIDTGRVYSYLDTFNEPNLTNLTATVDYGDNSGIQPLSLNATSFDLNHVYSSPGTYTVTVSITDNQGNTITKNSTVTVNNSDWTWDPANLTVDNTTDTAYTLNYYYDLPTTSTFNIVKLTWCGSGTSQTNADSLTYSYGAQRNILHIYNTSGTQVYSSAYTIPPGPVTFYVDCASGVVKINNTTIVTGLTTQGGTVNTIYLADIQGNNGHLIVDPAYVGFTSVCSPFFVNCSVVSSPPNIGTVTFTPNLVNLSTSTTATASFSDNVGGAIATWNWGDGNITNGTVTENNGAGTVTNSHTYTSLGSYTVILTVTNSVGSNSSQSVVSVIPTTGLAGSNLSHTNYSGADLSGQNISMTNLSVATFNNVNFQNANLSKINGSNSSFINDNFSNANLNKANISNSNLTGSNFTNAILTQANLSNANLTNVNFTGVNLLGANLSGTTTSGIIWSNTTCPNGTNSNNDGGTCEGQGGGL